jgi:hypothetical protein
VKVFLIGCGSLFAITVLAILFWIGYAVAVGPPTYAVPGHQVQKNHMKTIRDLGLIDPSEEIRYFYSDALTDIKGGMYFVTDSAVVMYCDEWEKPKRVISYAEIEKADAEFSDTWVEDSVISLTLRSGENVVFPVSQERKGDKNFLEFIQGRIEARQKAPEPVPPPAGTNAVPSQIPQPSSSS